MCENIGAYSQPSSRAVASSFSFGLGTPPRFVASPGPGLGCLNCDWSLAHRQAVTAATIESRQSSFFRHCSLNCSRLAIGTLELAARYSRIFILSSVADRPFLYPLKGRLKARRAAPGMDSSNIGPVLPVSGNGGTRHPVCHRSWSICMPRKVIGTMFGFALCKHE